MATRTDVADQHDLGVGGDVLLEDWTLLFLSRECLTVPRSLQGLGRGQVEEVKPAFGAHRHHKVLGQTEVWVRGVGVSGTGAEFGHKPR